jgi:hypothetical protein
MKMNVSSKIRERRKKRFIIPALYFLAEMVLAWLVLALVQVNFDIKNWSLWSLVVISIFMVYSLSKTIHVYKRQKNYKS